MKIKTLLSKGDLIGDKYKIIKFIETGSLGDNIYLCQLAAQADKMFMLRLLPKDVCQDQEMLGRFIQEAEINISMHHLNILPAIEFSNFNNTPFLVTGYIESENLKIYQAMHGSFSVNQTLAIILPLIDALKYAWDSHKIIHRNIKPESILIASPDFPILQDFGLSKTINDDANSMELTMMDVTIGNADYMSPEQATGNKDLDFRSDMYCLGLVAYEMLTKQHPFGNLPQIAMMMAQVNRVPKPINQINHTIASPLADIIAKMLEKKVENRYDSWDDLLDALNSYKDSQQPVAVPKTVATREIALPPSTDNLETPLVHVSKEPTTVVNEKRSAADYAKAINGIAIIIITVLAMTVNELFYYLLFIIGLNLYQSSFSKTCLIEKFILKLKQK